MKFVRESLNPKSTVYKWRAKMQTETTYVISNFYFPINHVLVT